MPLFAAGIVDNGSENTDEKYVGRIDPATMLSIIRVQNDQKNAIQPTLVDPMPKVEKRQRKKEKKERKRKKVVDEKTSKLLPGEVVAVKGIYYAHQVNNALFCIDRVGDPENRIFQRVYNGELPVYKRANRFVIGREWVQIGPKKKNKKSEDSRYYSKQNRKVIKAAPAATARIVRNRLNAQTAIDDQKTHLIIYETELVEEAQPNTGIEILQLKTRDFNRKLQEDKTNINLWLEFVDFQDELFQDQIEKAENGRNISEKTLNEKKVKIIAT